MRKTAAKVLDAVTTSTLGSGRGKLTRRKRAAIVEPVAPEAEAASAPAPAPAPASETRIAAPPPAVPHEKIAARAYALYLARGGAHGHAHEDWARAERELSITAR